MIINSIDELPLAVAEIEKYFPQYRIFSFDGEMGAGKTTLIKSLCQYLGVTDNITSPSFAIINEYECGEALIYHFDCYRIENPNEAIDIGFETYFESGHLCFIEWAEKIEMLLPSDTVTVKIDVVETNTRKIEIHLPA